MHFYIIYHLSISIIENPTPIPYLPCKNQTSMNILYYRHARLLQKCPVITEIPGYYRHARLLQTCPVFTDMPGYYRHALSNSTGRCRRPESNL
jgi:hypothetical protein